MLVSMLDRGELFFVRIDKVDDPKEGTVPEFNLRERMPTYKAQYPDRTEEQHRKSFDDIDNHVAELIRQGKVLSLLLCTIFTWQNQQLRQDTTTHAMNAGLPLKRWKI
jgi:hypothetical protein